MGTIVVACQTIKNEVNLAIAETGVEYPVLLIESGLHNYPDLLHQKIQEVISKIDNVENILMAFGYCGNCLIGLKSPVGRIIIPRVDDCISLLIGSYELRQEIDKEVGSYFLTKGWLENEQNIYTEYERNVKRHGRAKATKIMKVLLRNYQRLIIINSQTEQIEEDFRHKTRFITELFGLKQMEITGSSRFLKKLLTGPWDDEFIIIQPGEKVTFEHMGIDDLTKENNQLFGFSRG